jgi:Flp pilus assembly pilin Flp
LLEREMSSAIKLLARLLQQDDGSETLEWGLVCALLVLGALMAVAMIGPKVAGVWNDTNSAVPSSAP